MTDWDDVWSDMDEGGAPDPLLAEFSSPPGRSLDIGCGMGDNVLALAAAGWDAHGCDASRVAIERCRARSDMATFHVADVTEGLPTGPWNLITMFYVHLAHEDHADLLGRMHDALAPGGTFLYVGHDEAFAASHHGHMGSLEHADTGHGHGHDAHHGHHDHHDEDDDWADRDVGDPAHIAGLLTGLDIVRAESVERRIFHGPQEIDVTDVVVVGRRQS